MLFDPLSKRYTIDQLEEAKKATTAIVKNPLGPSSGNLDMIKDFDLIFKMLAQKDDAFFAYLKTEGALSVLGTTAKFPGIIHPGGTYNYRKNDSRPIPYFAISPENFGKLKRLTDRGITPKIKFRY